jgi:F-type H+-transporting ATPase subunit b
MFTSSVFLIPNGTFFVELAVVLVILYLAAKKILPPLNKALEERQEKIRASLAAADDAKAAAQAAGDERQVLLNDARNQARDIVAGAQATADQIKADQGEKGQAEYDRRVAAATAEVGSIRQRAIDEASARIGEVVFELVSKIVGREVDQSAHQDLVREAVEALKGHGSQGAGR